MRAPALVAMALIVAALGACDTAGMAFRVDDSLEAVAPEPRSTVTLPVTVRWSDDDAPQSPAVSLRDADAEYYGVFIDRSPIRPGADVLGVLEDVEPDECLRDPACPGSDLLRDHGVVLTATPDVALEFLRDLRPTSRGTSKDPHEVTVVRMQGRRRVGEAALRINFFVRR